MKGVIVPAYGPAETSLVYKEDLPLPPDPQPDQVRYHNEIDFDELANGATQEEGYGLCSSLPADTHPPPSRHFQVLVRVMAAGTNPIDYKLRNGDLAMIMKIALPFVVGIDLAGVVEKVGTAAAGTFKVRGD